MPLLEQSSPAAEVEVPAAVEDQNKTPAAVAKPDDAASDATKKISQTPITSCFAPVAPAPHGFYCGKPNKVGIEVYSLGILLDLVFSYKSNSLSIGNHALSRIINEIIFRYEYCNIRLVERVRRLSDYKLTLYLPKQVWKLVKV